MAAKNKFKAKRKGKSSGQASFDKFETKYETKFENQYESNYKSEFESRPKPSSSRSSSACSSAGSSASCNLVNGVQLADEKSNASKSASQSNLSDISSSGFSSASTTELKGCRLVDNASSFNSQFNQKFQSPVGEAHKVSRSCSPSSTSSSSSSTKLFVFDKNANRFKASLSVQSSAKCSKQQIESDVNPKSAIKSDLVNGSAESTKSGDWPLATSLPAGRSRIDRFLGTLSAPVQLLSNACKWAHHHADYLAILTLSVLINLNTLSAGFVYDDK